MRSIAGPAAFIETNIVGTCTLLEATREYWNKLEERAIAEFCFHRISTVEVYGSLQGKFLDMLCLRGLWRIELSFLNFTS